MITVSEIKISFPPNVLAFAPAIIPFWFSFRSCSSSFFFLCVQLDCRTGPQITRLEYVHDQTLIHRDVKPENVLIGRPQQWSPYATASTEDTLYLIDFGLARQHVDPETGMHILARKNVGVIGTYEFMSVNAHLKLGVTISWFILISDPSAAASAFPFFLPTVFTRPHAETYLENWRRRTLKNLALRKGKQYKRVVFLKLHELKDQICRPPTGPNFTALGSDVFKILMFPIQHEFWRKNKEFLSIFKRNTFFLLITNISFEIVKWWAWHKKISR